MNEPLRHNIYDFEVSPPDSSWSVIVKRLDDDEQYNIVSSKMNDHIVPPPNGTWDGILAGLENQSPNNATVLPIRRYSKIYRLATAAIVAGLLVGGWFIMKHPDINLGASIKKSIPFETAADENKNPVDLPAEIKDNTAQNADAKTTGLSEQTADLENDGHRFMRYSFTTYSPVKNTHTISVNLFPLLHESGAITRNMKLMTHNNKYVVVLSPNGQLTRLSSKFSGAIPYIAQEEYEEINTGKPSNTNPGWKKRLHEWRRKIKQSTYLPSSSNFLDILELKKMIEDK